MRSKSIAKDLGAGPDELRPALSAECLMAALTTVRERLEADPKDPSYQHVMKTLDQLLAFLGGGAKGTQKTRLPGPAAGQSMASRSPGRPRPKITLIVGR